MNLPPDIDQERLKIFNEYLSRIQFSEKICKSQIIDSTGHLIWEEAEEDYQKRMSELFYEVKGGEMV